MDLSFPRLRAQAELTVLPADLAVLMVGVAARQAASPTATAQASLGRPAPDPQLFAPVAGAFNGTMATLLTQWSEP